MFPASLSKRSLLKIVTTPKIPALNAQKCLYSQRTIFEKVDFEKQLPSTFAATKREVALEDCWRDPTEFSKYRDNRKQALTARAQIKKVRRIPVGPTATFCFENYDTIWIQVHEMVLIEKGGPEQFKDEVSAYSDLLPKGNNFVGTFMIEVDDRIKREIVLRNLRFIEDAIELQVFSSADELQKQQPLFTVKATPLGNDKSTPTKTAAIHFLSFQFTPEQVATLKSSSPVIRMNCFHPNYKHSTTFSNELVQSLVADLQ